MKTPFLVIRFILFALLGYHSVLAIALAAWNIASAKAAGVFVASGSILLIFNSCFFFLWMAIAVLEYLGQRKNAMASVVAYECAWAGVMSALELAAAIAVVLGGPPVYCHDRAPYQLCASSTILVPVSWFAGLLALSYFLVILSLSIGHMHSQLGLWQRSIYDVPWFDGDRADKNPPRLPPVNRHESTRLSFLTRRHSVSGAPNDAGHTSVTDLNAQKYPEDQVANDPPPLTQRTNDNDPSRPWWSRYRTRPGVDLPFAVRLSTMIGRRNTRLSDDVPPQDIHRDMEARAGLELLDPFSRRYTGFDLNERRQPKQSLPDSIGPLDMGSLDVDRPLPRPPRDEWVRADGSTASPRHKYDKRF